MEIDYVEAYVLLIVLSSNLSKSIFCKDKCCSQFSEYRRFPMFQNSLRGSCMVSRVVIVINVIFLLNLHAFINLHTGLGQF